MPTRATLALLLLATCARPGSRVTIASLPTALEAVAVANLRFLCEAERHEAELRTQDMLDVLYAESEIGVIGPGEFTLRTQQPKSLLIDTDLVLHQDALGVNPAHVALLAGTVSLHQGESATAMSTGATAQDYAGEIMVSLELIGQDGTTLVTSEARRELDPFAEHPNEDNRPELREAILEATRALVAAMSPSFVPWPRPAFAVMTNPAVVTVRAKSRDALLAADELERDQATLPVMHYFDADLPMARASWLFAAVGGGFCFGDDAGPELRAGDCVSAIDDAPADGAHAFVRALKKHAPLRLTVFRAGEKQSRVVTYAP